MSLVGMAKGYAPASPTESAVRARTTEGTSDTQLLECCPGRSTSTQSSRPAGYGLVLSRRFSSGSDSDGPGFTRSRPDEPDGVAAKDQRQDKGHGRRPSRCEP